MGKFDGLLLVSDFDDTVYTDTNYIPERNLKAIEYFRAEGGKFTIATGRSYRTFAPYRHLLPLDGPVVLSNGSALYDFDRDEMLVQTNLSPTAPKDFAALMDAFPSLAIETYNKEDIYVFRPNYVTDGHMKKVGTEYTVCEIEDMPVPWTKAIVQQEYPVLLEARDWLMERHGDIYEAIFSTLSSLVLTSSSTLTLDLLKGHIFKDMDEKRQVFVMRCLIVVFITISVVLAIVQYKSSVTFIAQLMGVSWGALAGAFLAPFLFGLYWKGTTQIACWCSFLFSTAVMLANVAARASFPALLQSPINAGAFCMVAGLIIVPAVSLITPKPNKTLVDDAFSCYDEKVTVSKHRALGDK